MKRISYCEHKITNACTLCACLKTVLLCLQLIGFIQPTYYSQLVRKTSFQRYQLNKRTYVYFFLPKTFLKSFFSFINSECQNRNTIILTSTSGSNLIRGEITRCPFIYILFWQLAIELENYHHAYYFTHTTETIVRSRIYVKDRFSFKSLQD